MIAEKNDNRWKKLVTGEIKHNFKVFSASMCVNRNVREVVKNPNEIVISNAIDEVYTFFRKYELLLNDDIKEIFG